MPTDQRITWTAVISRDPEHGDLDVTILKDIKGGVSGPYYTFTLGRETPLSGNERGVEYALRNHGLQVDTNGWQIRNTTTNMGIVANLIRTDTTPAPDLVIPGAHVPTLRRSLDDARAYRLGDDVTDAEDPGLDPEDHDAIVAIEALTDHLGF